MISCLPSNDQYASAFSPPKVSCSMSRRCGSLDGGAGLAAADAVGAGATGRTPVCSWLGPHPLVTRTLTVAASPSCIREIMRTALLQTAAGHKGITVARPISPPTHQQQRSGIRSYRINILILESRGTMTKTLKNFVNGQLVDSVTSRFGDVFDPALGSVASRVPLSTAADVALAVAAAKGAFESWSATPPVRRARVMFELKRLLDVHLDELSALF